MCSFEIIVPERTLFSPLSLSASQVSLRFGGSGVGDDARQPSATNAAPLAYQAHLSEQVGLHVKAVKPPQILLWIDPIEGDAHGYSPTFAAALSMKSDPSWI